MGCCASSTTSKSSIAKETKVTKHHNSTKNKIPMNYLSKESATANANANPEACLIDPSPEIASSSAGTLHVKPIVTDSTVPASFAAPAPGVKHVRAAYSGKGWAPPQKEWESNQKQVGNKTRTEIEDEWDDDGNLRRTTTKHITTPDWKKKTEKTVEIIPAYEAEEMGLGRK